jgi:FtsP/CotA-like multicopper oxidase with cupredoxin domain
MNGLETPIKGREIMAVIRPLLVLAAPVAVVAARVAASHHSVASVDARPIASANDNRIPAGTRVRDSLVLRLTIQRVAWHILGDSNPAFTVAAFAEEGKAPTIPAPLLRVRVGTPIRVIVRNTLDDTLMVHGLSERGGIFDSLKVPPGGSSEVIFVARHVGTYQYWASLAAAQRAIPLPPALRPYGLTRARFDSQLAGAFIVDPPGPVAPDRVFVLTETADQEPPTRRDPRGPPGREFTAINGRSWPYTERLHYTVGDTVRWRVINTTFQFHPMHLHGFYFRVDSHGSALRGVDSIYSPAARRMAVTEVVGEGESITMVWSPERPGGWIFHCHLTNHAAKMPAVDRPNEIEYPATHDHGDPDHHMVTGMNGLVLGITVGGKRSAATPWHPVNRLRLFVQSDSAAGDSSRRFGYVLQRGAEPRRDSVESPGPLLLLTRGEPTTIEVVNRTPEPTSVHWHGIELESYYDGAVGWSGNGNATAPAIRPESTFEVRITPRRAGTFMYHTHFNEMRQQYDGLVGPLVVLEPGERWDPQRDLLFVVSDGPHASLVINGSSKPAPKELRVGTTYRLRVADIAIYRQNLIARMLRDSSVVSWRAVAKDGFSFPANQATIRPSAARVASGETVDFEFTPDAPGEFTFEIGTPPRGGGFQRQGAVVLHVSNGPQP